CFSSPPRMKLVSQKLKFILVPVDKVQEDGRCFTVATSAHRRELIQSYVRRLDPAVSISFSSAELRKEHCQIKVEKIKTLKSDITSAKVNLEPTVAASQQVANKTSTEISSISTLKDFELVVNQDSIKGECK